MNGDTLNGVNRSFWEESLRQNYPIAIEPEVLYNNFQTLATNVMSWAYWQYFWGILNPVAPPVSTFKAMTNGKHLGMSVKIDFSQKNVYGTTGNSFYILVYPILPNHILKDPNIFVLQNLSLFYGKWIIISWHDAISNL